MEQIIQCFIGDPIIIQTIISPLMPIEAKIDELSQGWHCLFLSEELHESIHRYQHADNRIEIEPFDSFDYWIKEYLETIQPYGNLAYIETEYFEGEGIQYSGFIKDGRLLKIYRDYTHTDIFERPINKALRQLGVLRHLKMDEFDSLGLGIYRDMNSMTKKEFDKLLAQLKKRNGEFWIRILGELQGMYNEACFWVLVRDTQQAAAALKYLQGELWASHIKYSSKLTVGLTIKKDGKRYICGFFEGNKIFGARSLFEMDEPIEGEGEEGPDIFDRPEWD